MLAHQGSSITKPIKVDELTPAGKVVDPVRRELAGTWRHNDPPAPVPDQEGEVEILGSVSLRVHLPRVDHDNVVRVPRITYSDECMVSGLRQLITRIRRLIVESHEPYLHTGRQLSAIEQNERHRSMLTTVAKPQEIGGSGVLSQAFHALDARHPQLPSIVQHDPGHATMPC
ncbi:hypothetical protein DVZ84_34340 [Streptomyces parvulus]|uniref:Uncharacterized protein n=1 Tax=Streptomyces parvulus TaxID=146923 RepID=A0A369UV68_9ACTN|nr:hypothetical protein DVZ84_34340 [Streptomyces parvulus]